MTAGAKKTLDAVVSAAEAQQILGLSKTRTHQLIKAGLLDWRYSGGIVLVTRESCELYVRDQSRCGLCGRVGVFLCDGPGARPGKTCDASMCPEHRKPVGRNQDLCPRCAPAHATEQLPLI